MEVDDSQLAISKFVQSAHQNVVSGIENTHELLKWCKKKRIKEAFVAATLLEKNVRSIQTHLSFTLMSVENNRRRVSLYLRKGLEKKVKVVLKEDSDIII